MDISNNLPCVEDLLEKNEDLYDLAQTLLNGLVTPGGIDPDDDETDVERDVGLLDDALDVLEEFLAERGYKVCRPFREGSFDELSQDSGVPCYRTNSCTREDCPYRKELANAQA